MSFQLKIILALEAIGAISVLSTGEISPWICVLPFLGQLLVPLKLHRFNVVTFLSFLGLLIYYMYKFFTLNREIVYLAAEAIFALHAWSIVFLDIKRGAYFRVTIAWLETLLAGSLTPELHLLFFVWLQTLGVTFWFHENRLLNFRPLQRGSIELRRSRFVLVGVGLIAFSACLFPIIPRIKIGNGAFGNKKTIDYTEQIDFSNSSEWDSKLDQTIVMRFISERPINWELFLPERLIKVRTFSKFNGVRWEPLSSRAIQNSKSVLPTATPHRPFRATVTLMNELEGTVMVPHPYSTFEILKQSNLHFENVRNAAGGQWVSSTESTPAVYQLNLEIPTRQRAESNNNADLEVPEVFARDPQFHSWVNQLLPSSQLQSGALPDVLAFAFKSNNYKANYKGYTFQEFLYSKKEGHCEYFATATILALRYRGIPARLATGFKVMPQENENIAWVQKADAHAWVEYQTPAGVWMPLDSMPFQIKTLSTFERIFRRFQGQYQLTLANLTLWFFQYNLENQINLMGSIKKLPTQAREFKYEDAQKWLNRNLFSIVIILLCCVSLIYLLYLLEKPGEAFKNPHRKLRERGDILRKALHLATPQIQKKIIQREKLYERLRFSASLTKRDRNSLVRKINLYDQKLLKGNLFSKHLDR